MPAPPSGTAPPRRWSLWVVGVALFAFIPLVLFLLVVHPAPVGGSLALAVGLMVGHRFLARPYMEGLRRAQCLWCKRIPPAAGPGGEPPETIELLAAGGSVTALCCAGHGAPVARFFAFTHAWRTPLRLGIFVPLLALLAALAAAAWGWPGPLASATNAFRLSVGMTVNLAAWGYLTAAPARPARVDFPVHNFFLLGVHPLLWVLRVVGAWWIVAGTAGLLRG